MTEYPRDHWKSLLLVEGQEEFQKLIEMSIEEGGYQVIKNLQIASVAIGRWRNYCGRIFVTHYPFMVCVNRQKGAFWKLPYCLFERLTDAYFFREGFGAPAKDQAALMPPSPGNGQAALPAPISFQTEQTAVRLHPGPLQDFIGSRTLPLARMEFEAWYMRRVLEVCNGNRNAASKIMGISRASFYRKLGEYRLAGLLPPDV